MSEIVAIALTKRFILTIEGPALVGSIQDKINGFFLLLFVIFFFHADCMSKEKRFLSKDDTEDILMN